MADIAFEVPTRDNSPITFTLGPEGKNGKPYEYTFTPPKRAVAFLPILGADAEDTEFEATKSVFTWLDTGLSEKDRTRIYDRLKDPEDDLDIGFMSDIATALMEKVGGRPTG